MIWYVFTMTDLSTILMLSYDLQCFALWDKKNVADTFYRTTKQIKEDNLI